MCAELTICGKETAYYRHLRIPPLPDPDSCPLLLPKTDTVVTSKTTSVFCLFLNLIRQEPQDAFFLPSFLRCYTDECQQCVSEVHPVRFIHSTVDGHVDWSSPGTFNNATINILFNVFGCTHSYFCRDAPIEDRTAEPQGWCICSLGRSCPTHVHVEVNSTICFLLQACLMFSWDTCQTIFTSLNHNFFRTSKIIS